MLFLTNANDAFIDSQTLSTHDTAILIPVRLLHRCAPGKNFITISPALVLIFVVASALFKNQM